MRYHLAESANGHFSIDEVTGVIRLEKPLKESHSVLELTVLAKDRGVPQSLSSFTTVSVSVVDLKEYLPVFLNTEYLVEVKENVAVGTEVLNLSTLTRATVANTEIRYEITNGNDLGKFRLHSTTGELFLQQIIQSTDCSLITRFLLSLVYFFSDLIMNISRFRTEKEFREMSNIVHYLHSLFNVPTQNSINVEISN